MSNAWTVACRPFAGLRVLALPPWSVARIVPSPKPSPPLLPRLGARHGLPRLAFLHRRQFSSSASPLARRAARSPPKNAAKDGSDDEEDARLPDGDLPQEKITRIFGVGTTAERGNALLRALQHRRLSGSLADKGVHFAGATAVPQPLALNALEYLRATYPVDEEAAAAEWARREAQRLEADLVDRAQNLGLYKKTEASPQANEGVYGYSELEALRHRNEALYEEQKRKKELEEEKAAKGGKPATLAPVKSRVELTPRKEKSEWIKYYEEQAMMRKEQEAPKMSTARRILPTLLVAATTLALLYTLTQTYTPPRKEARLWPATPPALATCLALLNINLLVFLAWRIPPFWRTLNRFFMQTPGYPTALSALGNVFSHQEPKHLFWNMLLLMAAGPQLHELVGRANFLAIYLGGGVVASSASLVFFVLTRNLATSSLGASGALAATIAALLLLKDSDSFAVPFRPDWRIPVSDRAFLAACLLYEVYGITRGRGVTGMDHIAHLGGYATGMATAVALKSQMAERNRLVDETKKKTGFLQRTFSNR